MEKYLMESVIEQLGYEPKILFSFRRAFEPAVCDDMGWVIENQQGKSMLVLTCHGHPYIGDKEEVEEVEGDVSRYENLLDGAKEALKYFKK